MVILSPLRYLASAFSAQNSPRQLALGFALGAVIGLVPKGNLTAMVLMMLLFAFRVNLGAGLLGAFVFSWIAVLTDPIAHQVGQSLLTAEPLKSIWTALYDMPVVPWTAFNNTLVLGSFLLGLAAFYPICRLSEPIWTRYWPPLQNRLRKFRVVKLLWGAQITTTLGSH